MEENLAKKTKAELIAMIGELQAGKPFRCDHAAGDTITALLDIVKMSCEDHCPHHRRIEACKNCAIRQKLIALKLA